MAKLREKSPRTLAREYQVFLLTMPMKQRQVYEFKALQQWRGIRDRILEISSETGSTPGLCLQQSFPEFIREDDDYSFGHWRCKYFGGYERYTKDIVAFMRSLKEGI